MKGTGRMDAEIKNGKGVLVKVVPEDMPAYRKRSSFITNYPKIVQIPITEKCNISCVFCGARQVEYVSGIYVERGDVETWILDKLGGELLAQAHLYLTGGGEPLISKAFWDFICGRRPSRMLSFNTNGIFLTPQNIDKLMAYKGELATLSVSINACRPETYKRLMGVDGFNAVIGNFKNLKAALKAAGSKTHAGISMVVVKENLEEIPLMPVLAKELGADFVAVRNAEFNTPAYTKDWFSTEEQDIRLDKELVRIYEGYMSDLAKACREAGLNLVGKDDVGDTCNELFNFIGLRANGESFSCCLGASVPTGNLKDHADLWGLWNSEKLMRMREQIMRGEIPPECRQDTCPYWREVKKGGKYDAKSYLCEFSGLCIDAEVTRSGLEIRRNSKALLKGSVKNCGNETWSNAGLKENGLYKIGGRILDRSSGSTVKELRCNLSAAVPAGGTAEFGLLIDTAGLDAGAYILKLDMVREQLFWFEDKWNSPFLVRLNITASPRP